MNTAGVSNPKYLWFERAGRRFAVSMDDLQEVLPSPALRPLPAGDPALSGLMFLREEVLPVFDPAALAGFRTASGLGAPVVIVLEMEGCPIMGLLAEAVGKVVELPVPTPMVASTRLGAVFAGVSGGSGQPKALVFDTAALAATMGLAVELPAD